MPRFPLIEFQNVTIRRGARTVLDAVSLVIEEGEHVAIVGPNGSGKSTLVKAITRDLYPIVKPEPSFIRILGRDRWNLFELRGTVGIVSNDWAEICKRNYSARETVLSGFFGSVGVWPYHLVTAAMERRADEVLEMLEVAHLAGRSTNELSSGEMQRVLVGRALVHAPRALMLDEPTASLDLRAAHELRATLRKLARSGISILMVTHHLPDIIPEIGRVIMMRDGGVFLDGPKRQVLTAARLSELFRTPVEVVHRHDHYHMW